MSLILYGGQVRHGLCQLVTPYCLRMRSLTHVSTVLRNTISFGHSLDSLKTLFGILWPWHYDIISFQPQPFVLSPFIGELV